MPLPLRFEVRWIRRTAVTALAVVFPALLGASPALSTSLSLSAEAAAEQDAVGEPVKTGFAVPFQQIQRQAPQMAQPAGVVGGSSAAVQAAGTANAPTSLFQTLQGFTFGKPLHGIRIVCHYEKAKVEKCVRLREEIYIEPATASTPVHYALTLIGVEGMHFSDQQFDERRRTYDSHSGFLLNHRDFNVRDWRLAAQHYTLSVRSVVEGGKKRDVYSIVPVLPGRSRFEVRVDPDLAVVVGHSEFDAVDRLVLEWKYETLEVGAAVKFPEGAWYWAPIRPIQVHSDVPAAAQAVSTQFIPRIPQTTQIPAGFSLAEVRTTFDPLARKHYLILDYTDGISSMFLVESAGGQSDEMNGSALEPKVYRHVAGGYSQCWATRGNLMLLVVSRVTDRQIPDFLISMLR